MRIGDWAAIGAATLLLASCKGEAPAPEPSQAAAPADAAPGITLSDARVQLPVVSGRPGAAYFTLSQANGAPRKLVGVAVEMAGRAEMHETAGDAMKPVSQIALQAGKAVQFAPGGYHVMLFDLDPKLRFAKEVRITALLDDGAKAYATAPVTTVAESMEHMEGMH